MKNHIQNTYSLLVFSGVLMCSYLMVSQQHSAARAELRSNASVPSSPDLTSSEDPTVARLKALEIELEKIRSDFKTSN